MRGRPNPNSAFTLIEVLVTVVILSVGIVMVLRALDSSLVALTVSRESLHASSLIRDKMTELELSTRGKESSSPSSSSGRFDKPYSPYTWRVLVSSLDKEVQVGKETIEWWEVEVVVKRDGSRREYSAVTYLRSGG